MARAATTSDVFNAVAEYRRRRILTILAAGERSVSELARSLRVRQSQTSKHLRVLRKVGLVDVRGDGQRRLYSLHARALEPMHHWVTSFERYWNEEGDGPEAYAADAPETMKPGRPI
jgi:DNA-binding transcriptional ArsR family regulator